MQFLTWNSAKLGQFPEKHELDIRRQSLFEGKLKKMLQNLLKLFSQAKPSGLSSSYCSFRVPV